jgi:hypothetical protein
MAVCRICAPVSYAVWGLSEPIVNRFAQTQVARGASGPALK